MSVREKKAWLGEELDAVEGGELIGVTNHGRTVARAVPTIKEPRPREMTDALHSHTA